MGKPEIITIIGPTACGKTELAARLASRLGSEVISADSRQIYKGMDIGTGKDLCDYNVEGRIVPYHLIDIKPAGYRYNLYEYQTDFTKVFSEITQRGITPILCGGTGLYVEAALKGYCMIPVPENTELRNELESKSLEELTALLSTYKTLHNQTDVDTKKRAIRAIEICEYYKSHPGEMSQAQRPQLRSLTIGIDISREKRRERISSRLRKRTDEGLTDEVKSLLDSGLSPDDLIYYGLEYKFVTKYVIGEYTKEQMLTELEIAIHQFAKRQMTWFRGMEKRGIPIIWIDYEQSLDEKVGQIIKLYEEYEG